MSMRIYHSVLLILYSPLLQDQFDNVSTHTLKGVEFLEKYGRFQKDRCDVENRYAADLR